MKRILNGFFIIIVRIEEQKPPEAMNKKIPNIVKAIIKSHDPNAQVILFGSRARGDYHSSSDWDFLVLISDDDYSKTFKYPLWDELYQLELKYEKVINSIIQPKGEWMKRKVTPLYDTIAQEGIEA